MKNLTKVALVAAIMAASSASWASNTNLGGGIGPIGPAGGGNTQLPEPASLALLAAGIAGGIAALRGRRK